MHGNILSMHYSINPAGPVGQSLEKSHKDHLKVFISHGIQLVRPPFTKTRSVGANNSNVTMVYGTYNYSIHGFINQRSHHWGAHSVPNLFDGQSMVKPPASPGVEFPRSEKSEEIPWFQSPKKQH